MLIRELISELKKLQKTFGKDAHVVLIEELGGDRFRFAPEFKIMPYGRKETGETSIVFGLEDLETTISVRLRSVPKPELKAVK